MATREGGCRKTVSANADKMAAKENCGRRLDSDHSYNMRNPEMATRTWLQWKVAAKSNADKPAAKESGYGKMAAVKSAAENM